MDIVFIEQLEIETLIGVHDFERARPRPLSVDVELGFDNRRAAAADRVADTVDYDAVCARIAGFAGQCRYRLIETLAERLADMLLREFDVRWLRLRITKPDAVPAARRVGVVIERGRRE
ncbi:MAG TPA: dihydroneopterin aldolase [Xanthomonadaceae bacterium]|nr:dihydroneopterin aldolase [Xanthomonadaceae bacterium]